MEMDSNWSGSLSIGVTALQPEVVVSANKADELTGQSFVITPSTSKGTAVLCVGGQVICTVFWIHSCICLCACISCVLVY